MLLDCPNRTEGTVGAVCSMPALLCSNLKGGAYEDKTQTQYTRFPSLRPYEVNVWRRVGIRDSANLGRNPGKLLVQPGRKQSREAAQWGNPCLQGQPLRQGTARRKARRMLPSDGMSNFSKTYHQLNPPVADLRDRCGQAGRRRIRSQAAPIFMKNFISSASAAQSSRFGSRYSVSDAEFGCPGHFRAWNSYVSLLHLAHSLRSARRVHYNVRPSNWALELACWECCPRLD